MNWYKWLLIFVLFNIFFTFVVALVIYLVLLVRTSKKKWGRCPSMPSEEEYMNMYNKGLVWAKENEQVKTEVDITSNGYHLFGEYFNFGFDKAVIIIPGRMESLLYSYYYAEPYKKAGFNVLVIDDRAHGLSEGIINSLGYKEYIDVINWSKYLHDELKNINVVLHGICIGASTSIFALTNEKCPEYISAMVADGMYVNFYESCKNHMLVDKRPIFPFFYQLIGFVRLISQADVKNNGPFKKIDKLKRPILFIHSKEDLFSLPEKAQWLYDNCSAEKRIVWFEHGGHSKVRINNEESYDQAIFDFYEYIKL